MGHVGDNGDAVQRGQVNLQFNVVSGSATIQAEPNGNGVTTHPYEDPEDLRTDWLLLDSLRFRYRNETGFRKWDPDEVMGKYNAATQLSAD